MEVFKPCTCFSTKKSLPNQPQKTLISYLVPTDLASWIVMIDGRIYYYSCLIKSYYSSHKVVTLTQMVEQREKTRCNPNACNSL